MRALPAVCWANVATANREFKVWVRRSPSQNHVAPRSSAPPRSLPPSLPGALSSRPPTRSRASRHRTSHPESVSAVAAANPAGPAPTTITRSRSACAMGGVLSSREFWQPGCSWRDDHRNIKSRAGPPTARLLLSLFLVKEFHRHEPVSKGGAGTKRGRNHGGLRDFLFGHTRLFGRGGVLLDAVRALCCEGDGKGH